MPIAIVLSQPQLRALRNTLFQFRSNHKFLPRQIILNMEHIGFATHLAIFYIGLPTPRRFIDCSLIALAATRTLKAGFHRTILGQSKQGEPKAPP
jgi:hypothetical protein